MKDEKNTNNPESESKTKKQYNELEENNAFYDITGNMNNWRVHETYEGSGNKSVWEKILKDNRNIKILRKSPNN